MKSFMILASLMTLSTFAQADVCKIVTKQLIQTQPNNVYAVGRSGDLDRSLNKCTKLFYKSMEGITVGMMKHIAEDGTETFLRSEAATSEEFSKFYRESAPQN